MRNLIGPLVLILGAAAKNWEAAAVGGFLTGGSFGGWWYAMRLGVWEQRQRTRRVRNWLGGGGG